MFRIFPDLGSQVGRIQKHIQPLSQALHGRAKVMGDIGRNLFLAFDHLLKLCDGAVDFICHTGKVIAIAASDGDASIQ
ncbi:hypothetical protein O4J55_27670, partial [Paracoccus sp. PXZ]